MPFGFNSRRVAQNASAIAKQRPPRSTSRSAQEVQNRNWIVRTRTGGIPAATGNDMGSAKCTIIISDEGGSLTDQDDPTELEVFNLGQEDVPEDTLVVAKQIGGVPVVDSIPEGTVTEVVKFKLLTMLSTEGWGTAEVLAVYGGSTVSVGETIEVGSTVPMYRTLKVDGIGLALLAGNDPAATPPVAQAWHIIHAQLPTDAYVVRLDEDLYSNNNAVLDWDSQPLAIPWNVEPYTQYQTWLTVPGSRPTVTNPYYHDGMAGKNVEIRLAQDNPDDTEIWYVDDVEEKKARLVVADVLTGDGAGNFTLNTTTYYSGQPVSIGNWSPVGLPNYQYPSTDYQTNGPPSVLLAYDSNLNIYQFVNHVKHVAKWVLGSFTIPADSSGSIEVSLGVSEYFDGYNPGSAVPAKFNVPNALNGCESKSTFGWATYVPEDQKYQIISTVAGLMGSPHSVQVPVGAATATIDPADPCGQPLCYTTGYQTIAAFGCEPQTVDDLEQKPVLCISQELCEFICSCCDTFAVNEDVCGDPCLGYCTWTWDETAGEWTVPVNNCDDPTNCDCIETPSMTPAPTDGEERNAPCGHDDPPPPCQCGTCTWAWNSTSEGWDLLLSNCESLCVCSPALGVGTVNGEQQVTCCVPTDPPVECCDECGGDEVRITGYTATAPMQFDISQTGPSVSSGSCTWKLPVQVTTYEGDEPHDIYQQYNDEVTITHDAANLWDCSMAPMTIPHTNPPGGTYQLDSSWSGTKVCNDTSVSCNDLPGDCGDNELASFLPTRFPCPNAMGLGDVLWSAHSAELGAYDCSSCQDARKMLNTLPLAQVKRRRVAMVKVLTSHVKKAGQPPIEAGTLGKWINAAITEFESIEE